MMDREEGDPGEGVCVDGGKGVVVKTYRRERERELRNRGLAFRGRAARKGGETGEV